MKSQSPYSIFVFLSKPLVESNTDGLTVSLRKAHFETLCEQYGLDPGGIQDVLAHLEIIGSPVSVENSFFMVKYGEELHQTLVIDVWNAVKPDGKVFLETVKSTVVEETIQKSLKETVIILRIALSETQLQDMGRLLAYEVARWTGFHGKAVVRGLDGVWYHLNQHQAFIPIN